MCTTLSLVQSFFKKTLVTRYTTNFYSYPNMQYNQNHSFQVLQKKDSQKKKGSPKKTKKKQKTSFIKNDFFLFPFFFFFFFFFIYLFIFLLKCITTPKMALHYYFFFTLSFRIYHNFCCYCKIIIKIL